jgi:peptidoglycan/LPS O-acetylase OafA/YrhL
MNSGMLRWLGEGGGFLEASSQPADDAASWPACSTECHCRRGGRTLPAQALRETAAERRWPHPVRVGLGLAAAGGAGILMAVTLGEKSPAGQLALALPLLLACMLAGRYAVPGHGQRDLRPLAGGRRRADPGGGDGRAHRHAARVRPDPGQRGHAAGTGRRSSWMAGGVAAGAAALLAVTRAATGTWVPYLPSGPAAVPGLAVAALAAAAVTVPFLVMSRRQLA